MKKYFKVGDEVISKRFGKGVVIHIYSGNWGEHYPIEVKFENFNYSYNYDETGKLSKLPSAEIDLYQIDKVTFQEKEEIKDEYIPFTYEDYNLLMGKWIKHKNSKVLLCIIRIYETKIGTYEEFVTYEGLLKNYEFSNGDPCGKKVE